MSKKAEFPLKRIKSGIFSKKLLTYYINKNRIIKEIY